jgi:hypothetical protein
MFIIWLIKFYKSKTRLSNSKISLYSSIFFYFSVIALVIITKVTLQNKLDSFDLNHDGMFTGSEITDAQKEALKNVSSDTSRTFAPIVAIPYSLIYFLIIYVILRVFRR